MTTPASRPAPSDDSLSTDTLSAHPDNAAIAEESAAIYPDTNDGSPTPEEIALEAYYIYMGRDAADGGDLEDWLEAERRLSARRREASNTAPTNPSRDSSRRE